MSWYDEFKAKGHAGYPVTKKFINELEEASQNEPFLVTEENKLYKKMTLLTAGYLDEVAHGGACSPYELLPESLSNKLLEEAKKHVDPASEYPEEDATDSVNDIALETVAGILKDFVLCLGLCDLDSDGYPKW